MQTAGNIGTAGNTATDPVIIVAEDNPAEARRLLRALKRAAPHHRIHHQPKGNLLKSDILSLNPKILILDRRMDERRPPGSKYEMEIGDMQIMAETFRREFPGQEKTVVIIFTNYGEPDYAKRFNARLTGKGIYYIRKVRGMKYLIDFIADSVLLQWPSFPAVPP